MNHMANIAETYKGSVTNRVRAALEATKRLMPEHYATMLRRRSEPEGGIGSVYLAKSEAIEASLLNRPWVEIYHKDVPPGCTAATASLPGKLGVIQISKLPDTTTFVLVDPKKTGFCELLVEGDISRREVPNTTLIMEKDEASGEEIVSTFHPGDPAPASTKPWLKAGTNVSYDEAVGLGFVYAKVV